MRCATLSTLSVHRMTTATAGVVDKRARSGGLHGILHSAATRSPLATDPVAWRKD